MTTIHTAHGVGEVVDTLRERGGRTSYKVKGAGFEVWVDAKDAHFGSQEGPENLFSYQFPPDKVIDNDAMARGGNVFAMGSRNFVHEPALHVNESNSTTLPYNPTPQYPVEMFTEQTIQPGEQLIDPKKRLSPSDSRTQKSRGSETTPGPSPNLFATGAYSVMNREASEIVVGRHPEGDFYQGDFEFEGAFEPDLTDDERGKRREDFPRQRRDPAAQRPLLRELDEPVYPFDKVSPKGNPVREMGEGEEPDWYSCPDCGAWHSPGRHQHKKHGPKPPRSDDIYQPTYRASGRHDQTRRDRFLDDPADLPGYEVWDAPDWAAQHPDGDADDPVPAKHRAASFYDLTMPTDMPAKFANVAAPEDYRDRTQIALAAIERQAAIVEGTYGLDFRVAQEMDLVQHDPDIREAAWRDVQRKAKRLRAEGRVSIKEASPEAIYASVQGDEGVYDTIIVRGNVFDLGGQTVTSWHCGCPWGQWAFKRRLTYVGRFCSHAYATYQEMRAQFDQPGKGTRERSAGVVEDFKSWATENDQPIDETSVTDFITQPTLDERLTEGEVGQLYDYLDGNHRMSPQREFDVPYTFDHDKVYKSGRDMLRTQPHSLTPDLQFVPEGEGEHFVDVTKDDRKTTGPGQIMHEGATYACDGEHDGEHDEGHEGHNDDDEVVHFAGLRRHCDEHSLPYPMELLGFMERYADEQVNNPTPGSPSNPRPDAGESTRDLNKLRGLIQEPLSDSFGDMDSRNDEVRGLVDDLHDGGVAASNLVAHRQFEADGEFLEPGGGGWADLPFAGSGPDPQWWMGTSEDYVNEHERPHYEDLTSFPDGDITKYNDSDGPVTSPKEPSGREARQYYADVFSNETSSMEPMGPNITPSGPDDVNASGAPLMGPGDDMSDNQMMASMMQYFGADEEFGGGLGDLGSGIGSPFGGGDGGNMQVPDPNGSSANHENPAPAAPATPPILPPGGSGWPGGGAGDYAAPPSPDKTMSAGVRPSIRDSIKQRNANYQNRGRYGYDTTSLPPGWGDVPSDPEDDESPFPVIPGQHEVQDMIPQIPGMPGGPGKGGPGGKPGGGMPGEIPPEIPPVVAGRGFSQPSDGSDIVRQFQETMGAQSLTRGGNGGNSQRAAAMGGIGGAPGGGRGRFSDGDIAGAADTFLQRTAGKTYTQAQQQELMDEYNPLGARNLGGLDLRGTHYEAARW